MFDHQNKQLNIPTNLFLCEIYLVVQATLEAVEGIDIVVGRLYEGENSRQTTNDQIFLTFIIPCIYLISLLLYYNSKK